MLLAAWRWAPMFARFSYPGDTNHTRRSRKSSSLRVGQVVVVRLRRAQRRQTWGGFCVVGGIPWGVIEGTSGWVMDTCCAGADATGSPGVGSFQSGRG